MNPARRFAYTADASHRHRAPIPLPPCLPPNAVQRALKSDADVDVRLAMDIIDLQLSNVEVLRDALGARDGLSQSERAEAQDAERVAEEDAIMQAELVRCPRWIPQSYPVQPSVASAHQW